MSFAARFPHLFNTWLWNGHTLSTEEPGGSLGNVDFCALAIEYPLRLPNEKLRMIAHDGRSISFFSIIPLYDDELQFKLDHGNDALLDLFDAMRVTELLDPTRPSVVPSNPPKRMFSWPNLLFRKTRG